MFEQAYPNRYDKECNVYFSMYLLYLLTDSDEEPLPPKQRKKHKDVTVVLDSGFISCIVMCEKLLRNVMNLLLFLRKKFRFIDVIFH